MRLMNNMAIAFLGVFAMACSVDKAMVNGNPPVTEKIIFKSDLIEGTFATTENPFVFFWPNLNEKGEPLGRDEEVEARAKIIAAVDASEGPTKELKGQIYLIQKTELEPLTKEFVGRKCGLFVDDFFGDKPDPSRTEVSDWREPKNDEEAVAINWCKDNQNTRTDIVKNQINPLVAEIGKLTLQILQAIGDENIVPMASISIDLGVSQKIEINGFQEKNFSTAHENSMYKVRDVAIDKEKGLIRFSVPAIKTISESEFMLHGRYNFALEMNLADGVAQLGGEFILEDYLDGSEKKGRVSFTGQITKTQ